MSNLEVTLDNIYLEKRLRSKDSVIFSTSITQCATKLQLLKSNKQDVASLQNFLREMLLIQLETNKSCDNLNVLNIEKAEYEKLEKHIHEQIDANKLNIVELEEELLHQKEIRKHRISCEKIAKDVNVYPARSALKRKIDTAQETMNNNNELLKAIDTDIRNRKEQFDMMMNALKELQKQYVVDEKFVQNDALDVEVDNTDGFDDRLEDDQSYREISSKLNDNYNNINENNENILSNDAAADGVDTELNEEDEKNMFVNESLTDFKMEIDLIE
jgi:hypothetical protein